MIYLMSTLRIGMMRRFSEVFVSFSGSEQTHCRSNHPVFSVILGERRGGVCEHMCSKYVCGGVQE